MIDLSATALEAVREAARRNREAGEWLTGPAIADPLADVTPTEDTSEDAGSRLADG